ncbi:metallophosphoesterase [uncultured Tateyamaria sp.]|uniref:metallophosphoesterase n=1 Tax=Tateyamaria sp. 1078 TaxID=3417464 RepID=UPI0026217AD9|nr:metallophosphoesterase [uncultured Tateyamaria sp.]
MFRKFFRSAQSDAPFPAVAPDAPVVVVGDIHGCAALLHRFLERVGDLPLVCVGDYVDRGPNSAEVLRTLQARPDITCLSGNHEVMMRDFLEAPVKEGARWLNHGGTATLQSFGLPTIRHNNDSAMLNDARDALAEAMGPDLVAWLVSLPPLWQSGNVAVVHAGADPDRPMNEQSDHDLHWGHPAFFKRRRRDGIWVVHGHTIVANPQARDGRISIDTGAYASGRLTGVRLEDGEAYAETVTLQD